MQRWRLFSKGPHFAKSVGAGGRAELDVLHGRRALLVCLGASVSGEHPRWQSRSADSTPGASQFQLLATRSLVLTLVLVGRELQRSLDCTGQGTNCLRGAGRLCVEGR